MHERHEEILHATFISLLAEAVAVTLIAGVIAVSALVATRLPGVPL